jgi:hypothetical protein
MARRGSSNTTTLLTVEPRSSPKIIGKISSIILSLKILKENYKIAREFKFGGL